MSKFAIIQTGGKQYRVSRGDVVRVEKLDANEGDEWACEKVLLVADGEEVKIGTPYVKNAKVQTKVREQGRADKKIVFRYKPKKRYRKKKGHRQPYTELEVTEVRG